MLKIGIIGFGKMGKIRAEAIKADGKACVKMIFDTKPSMISEDYAVAESPEAIWGHSDIDAVFICTPNCYNKTFTVQALQAGKHVFCEKPPAFTADDVREIRAVEQQTGKKLMYGFNHRHHSSVQSIKSKVLSGEYGKILWMRGRYGKSVDESFYKNWRSKKEMAGGGIFLDQGIHMLDLFLYLAEDFHDVRAFVSNLYWKSDIEDNVFAMFKNTETGVVASLHSTMTQWRHLFALEVFLEKGYLVLNGLKTSSGSYGDEILTVAKNRTSAPAATWEDEERTTFQTDMSWRSEVDHFFSAILNDRPIEIGTSLDALALMRIVDKVYQQGE